ncbi:MAG: enoyl-CoA hydratase/isomerase family protein [Dehalococcoidia bacterium]
MAYDGYSCLKTRSDRGVLFVTFDNPPINLLDLQMMLELDRLGREIEMDDNVKVVVFDSANPDFFIAHVDVGVILQLPTEVPPKEETLGFFHAMVDRFRTMPKVTIAKIEGCARGGGSEFVLSLDMRFAALGRAVLSQPEVAIGIIPGGSGTQRLPRVMGRARALEVVLGCDDFPAELAERYGYINRALPSDEIGPFVERLAYRIATFPAEAIALAKASVDSAELSTVQGLLEEAHYFNQSVATDEAQRRMRRFLELEGQTRKAELDLPAMLDRIAE